MIDGDFYVNEYESEINNLNKEIAALRRALKSHGEIVEENARLRLDLKDQKNHIQVVTEILEDFRQESSQGWDLIGLIETGKNFIEKSR